MATQHLGASYLPDAEEASEPRAGLEAAAPPNTTVAETEAAVSDPNPTHVARRSAIAIAPPLAATDVTDEDPTVPHPSPPQPTEPDERTPSAEEVLWAQLDGDSYDSAVYECPLLREMWEREINVAEELVPAHDVVVEVGVGTGKFAGPLSERGIPVVGVDISPTMLQVARTSYPDLVLIEGDACKLREILGPVRQADGRRLVACVLNSIGVVDPVVREALVREMIQAASGGSFLLVVFSAEHFHRGVTEFYARSPQLCGPVSEGDADYVRHELRTASNYFSHWFTVGEIDDMLRRAGVSAYTVERCGVGLFFAGTVQ
ncbi:MAG: methyltransferase domain-containing protein [Solirubrobacteraceae bacterium]